jgi:hypothetical protein
MNCLSEKLFNGEKWDFEKYCARSIDEFISMIKKFDGKLIVYEEASKDISIDKFYDDINHAFNIIMQTQQYKKNLVCLVFPFSVSVSKRQRYFIKLGLEVEEKISDEETHATVFKPTIYTRSFWTLDENDLRYKWWGRGFVKYSKDDLLLSKSYTDWLIGKKEEVLDEVQNDIRQSGERRKMECILCGRRVGLTKYNGAFFCNFHKPIIEPEEIICLNCGSIHLKGFCPLNLSYIPLLSDEK